MLGKAIAAGPLGAAGLGGLTARFPGVRAGSVSAQPPLLVPAEPPPVRAARP